MSKIKIPKQTKQEKIAKIKKSLQKQQLAIIEAKYGVKVEKLYRKYADKTWEEFWTALEDLKEEMRKELELIGIK